MKRIIFILFICFSVTGFAQNFINETKTWSTLKTDASYSPDHMDTTLSTFYTKFIGDTTINTQIYNKLYQSYDSLSTWSIIHLLREGNRKVFVWSPLLETDLLLYDFNLETGDTGYVASIINNNINIDSLAFIIDSTDIYMSANIEFKRLFVSLQLNSEQIQDVWIEGIGSTYGPLKQNCIGIIGCYNNFALLCMHHNTDLIYQNDYYSSCFVVDTLYNSINSIEKSINEVSIHPNPIKDFGYLDTDSKYKDLTINIYNLLGEKVKIFKIQSEATNKLHFSDFHDGLFIYKVISGIDIVGSGKILISR